MATQSKIARAAAAHSMSVYGVPIQLASQAFDPIAQSLGRFLQPIVQSTADGGLIAPSPSVDQRRCRAGPRRILRRIVRCGPASSVNGGGRQTDRRRNDDEIQRSKSGKPFNSFAPTATQGRGAGEEKRHVAPKGRGRFSKSFVGPVQIPDDVRRRESRGRVGRSARHARRQGNALRQPHSRPARNTGFASQRLQGSHDDVLGSFRHRFQFRRHLSLGLGRLFALQL